jgi:DNA-binding CsgD family transcriptional regulator
MVSALAPAGHWVFARFTPAGQLRAVLCSAADAPLESAAQFRLFDTELRHHDAAEIAGETVRVEVCHGAIAPFRHGLSVFARDVDGARALLVLLRARGERPFSRRERRDVAEALESCVGTLTHASAASEATRTLELVRRRAEPMLFVVDPKLRLVFHGGARHRRDASLDGLLVPSHGGRALPPIIDGVVRELLTSWKRERRFPGEQVALALPAVVVRVMPLHGSIGLHFAVLVERYRSRDSLSWAASRFAISRRELEVLALLLQGMSTAEIAARLNIAQSTADFHLKRLLMKADARNRSGLVAKVLGWRAGEEAM